MWDFLRLHLTARSREPQSENNGSERKKESKTAEGVEGALLKDVPRCLDMVLVKHGESGRHLRALQMEARGRCH